jgi:sec-independent protein translocase protein TatC
MGGGSFRDVATAIRTIGHEDRLSIVEHLDELRTRLIVSAVAVALLFGACLWQNHALLRFVNAPLRHQTERQVSRGEGPLGQTWLAQKAVREVARDTESVLATLGARGSGLSPTARARLAAQAPRLRSDVARLPRAPDGNSPVTLGVGEPFTTTLTITLYFALVLSLPILLFELYGFVLPAFTAGERRAVTPLLVAVPALFAGGVAFGYLVVLPAAVRFLQNFNASQFNVLVQASQYYKFAATTLLAMGLAFQAPVAILATVRAGLVTPRQLRRNRRYALLACAAVAAFLPGDAFTLVLETVPLYLLYEASILVATVVVRRQERGAPQAKTAGEPSRFGSQAGGLSSGGRPSESDPEARNAGEQSDTNVQEKIDHIDPELS